MPSYFNPIDSDTINRAAREAFDKLKESIPELNPKTSEVVYRLDADDLVRLDRQTDAIANSKVPHQTHNKPVFTYFVAFDGTGNNREDPNSFSGGLTTNVAELQRLAGNIDKQNKLQNFATSYWKGPGTEGSTFGSSAVPLAVGAEIRATANKAYENFALSAQQWLKTHPDGEINLYMTGFSRGGVTAAVFSQLVYENGLKTPDGRGQLIAPTQLEIAGAVIYDPVSTGYSKNTAFAPNAKNIQVVVAEHEYRTQFRVVNHQDNPNVTVHRVMGNHSNIGGGYDNGIGAKVLEASHEWLKEAGVPLAELDPQRRFQSQEAVIYHERNIPKAVDKDWPIDHDPKQGLRERRLSTGDAIEAVKVATGAVVFESVSGKTVYTEKHHNHGIEIDLKINQSIGAHLLLDKDKNKILQDYGAFERFNFAPAFMQKIGTPSFDIQTKQGIMKVIENIEKDKWDKVTGIIDKQHPAYIGTDIALSKNERYAQLSQDQQEQVVKMFIDAKNQELDQSQTKMAQTSTMDRSRG